MTAAQGSSRVVPVEPNTKMCNAGFDVLMGAFCNAHGKVAADVYRAMLAAAPSQSVGVEEIARVIDPDVWKRRDGETTKVFKNYIAQLQKASLTKAEKVLSLLQGQQSVSPNHRGLGVPDDGAPYLVWSNQHRAWWRPKSAGYTNRVSQAGRYTRAEALDISHKGRDGWAEDKGVPDEIVVAEADLPIVLQSATTTEGSVT